VDSVAIISFRVTTIPDCNKIKPHNLTHNTYYLTSNTIRVASRGVQAPFGAVHKRPHAVHAKVPGIIPGATWHTVTYCDTWQCYKNTRGMLETATETVGRNAYIFGFKISELPSQERNTVFLFMTIFLLELLTSYVYRL
jgi:hypothetical protein